MRRTRGSVLKGLLAAALALPLLSCSPARPASPPPVVDGEAALAFAAKAVAFGPRPSGSAACEAQAKWIMAEAKAVGADRVAELSFSQDTVAGRIKFWNILAEIEGDSSRFVIVAAHHDTKKLSSVDFIGANDGASGVGLLLSMIKAVKASGSKPPFTLRFIFFDGEECFLRYSDTDGLYGSRRLAKDWAVSRELRNCEAMILMDMVGDADLGIAFPEGDDKRLVSLALSAAESLGKSSLFKRSENGILDDHRPFQDLGVPAIDFIDFEYGPSHRYWHSSADTMDKLSAQSLKTAGDVAFRLLWALSAR